MDGTSELSGIRSIIAVYNKNMEGDYFIVGGIHLC